MPIPRGPIPRGFVMAGAAALAIAFLLPIELRSQDSSGQSSAQKSSTGEAKSSAKPAKSVKAPPRSSRTQDDAVSGANDPVVKFINEQIRKGWADNEIEPSERADDAEWMRRVYLDIVGHIPEADEVEAFLADKSETKRAQLINKLLEDPGYVRNFTTIWTNLLIGRQTPDRVSRDGLQKFLRDAFGRNRPWSEVVQDLLAAEGHFEERGEVNFLLAHLNDGAVPATAISARLFLGQQIQCTQCHNHPFNDWKQNAFWELNSFFKQARRVDHRKYNAQTGRMDFDYAELVTDDFEGGVFFEERNGLMRVAYPRFNQVDVDPGVDTDRRKELAKLLTEGERPQMALAIVNRMWGHYFGYGFTRPVDDMGPHRAPSHPELLDRLAEEFVKAKYDLKQLARWICNSEAYSLTSRYGPKNAADNPEAGETPLFSRVYVKSMTAEQLYDSLIIATNAHKSGRSNWEQAERQRQQWMQQFVMAFGTDENDEATTFNGTIPQALVLMNGELIQNALSVANGSTLHEIVYGKTNDVNKIRRLYMATLSRPPTTRELNATKKVLGGAPAMEAWQDLYWALLNSNEFIFNH